MVVAQSKDVVLAIFGGASAIGGLVLFFLGFVMSAFRSLPITATPSVKQPYRNIAGMAFVAFLMSDAALASVSIGSSLMSHMGYTLHWRGPSRHSYYFFL